MKNLVSLMRMRVSSDRADHDFGELAAYAASLFILVTASRAVWRMEATQAELVLGMLLTGVLSAQFVLMGYLIGLRRNLREKKAE